VLGSEPCNNAYLRSKDPFLPLSLTLGKCPSAPIPASRPSWVFQNLKTAARADSREGLVSEFSGYAGCTAGGSPYGVPDQPPGLL